MDRIQQPNGTQALQQGLQHLHVLEAPCASQAEACCVRNRVVEK